MAQSESRVELRSVYILKSGRAQKLEVRNDPSRGSLLRGERLRAALEARVVGSLMPDPAFLVIQEHVDASLIQMHCDKYT